MYGGRGEQGEGEKYEWGKEGMGKDYVREERVKREREKWRSLCGCEGGVGRKEGMFAFVCGKSAGKKCCWLI